MELAPLGARHAKKPPLMTVDGADEKTAEVEQTNATSPTTPVATGSADPVTLPHTDPSAAGALPDQRRVSPPQSGAPLHSFWIRGSSLAKTSAPTPPW